MGYAEILGGPRNFRFRIDPHSISWDYNLNTSVRETIGGQVIQLLSVNLGNLRVEASSGNGGAVYNRQVIEFCRDLALWQRDEDQPVTFKYSPRDILLEVFFQDISISDQADNVRRDFVINFNIHQDTNGSLNKTTMTEALERIEKGVGYESPGIIDGINKAINDGTSVLVDRENVTQTGSAGLQAAARNGMSGSAQTS